jgi:hypothetical protein
MIRHAFQILVLIGMGLMFPSILCAAERFYPVVPCRVLDTRNGQQGGALSHGEFRSLTIIGLCGIPSNATAAALNVAVVGPAPGGGHFVIFPYGTPYPNTATVNFDQGQAVVANGTIAGLTAGTYNVTAVFSISGGGQMHLILDVTGYFAP